MDPKARAEARRQAILGKGAKRLAKLTSSARGEESTASNDGVFAKLSERRLPYSHSASWSTAP